MPAMSGPRVASTIRATPHETRPTNNHRVSMAQGSMSNRTAPAIESL